MPFFRLRKEGLDNLPGDKGYILLPKHQRWEDIPLLSLASPRPLYYIAKYELFRNPFTGWFLSSLGGLPLNRSRPLESRRSLDSMINFLEEGEVVVIFPEGTYFKNRMGPGKKGLIKMVRSQLTLPYVPVGIQYERGTVRTGVRIRFGKPLFEDKQLDTGELVDRIMKEISGLSGLT